MMSHAGKKARDVYKTLQWTEEGDEDKFDKVMQAFSELLFTTQEHYL